MNLDANIRKVLSLVLKKWKIIVSLALIGIIIAYVFAANFTTQTYSSSVEFLAYAEDVRQEFNDSTSYAQAASYTSKMNYAMKILSTYVELFKTNEFNRSVANEINEKYGTAYSGALIKSSTTISVVNDTSMFKIIVSTDNADVSYQIAQQLEKSIPKKMETTNNGIVKASVEDRAVLATSSESPQYLKKCLIGCLAGIVIAIAYIILRDLLDVRVKSPDELLERYDIPVLGTIPEFELKSGGSSTKSKATKEKKGE